MWVLDEQELWLRRDVIRGGPGEAELRAKSARALERVGGWNCSYLHTYFGLCGTLPFDCIDLRILFGWIDMYSETVPTYDAAAVNWWFLAAFHVREASKLSS